MLKMSSSCWTLKIRITPSAILLEFGSTALLKKLKNQRLSLRRGLWRLQCWLRTAWR
jgi:hypothetical protein